MVSLIQTQASIHIYINVIGTASRYIVLWINYFVDVLIYSNLIMFVLREIINVLNNSHQNKIECICMH